MSNAALIDQLLALSRGEHDDLSIAKDAADALAAQEWRTLSTAPQDGSEVLVGRFAPGQKYHGRVRVDWWRNHMKHGFIGFGQFNPQYWPATHWMPKPPPPQSAPVGKENDDGRS